MIQLFQNHIFRIETMIEAGGFVMPPLIALSVVMWILIIHRVFFFRRLYRKNMTRKKAAKYLKEGRYPNFKTYRGATALLLTRFLDRKSNNAGLNKFILDEAVLDLISSLNRYLSLIGVLATLAPLLGLLGTVTGMMTTFDVISVFGTGNAKAMAGGIKEALITTQTGLMVAIPGLYMSHFLNRRAENLKQRILAIGSYLRRRLR